MVEEGSRAALAGQAVFNPTIHGSTGRMSCDAVALSAQARNSAFSVLERRKGLLKKKGGATMVAPEAPPRPGRAATRGAQTRLHGVF